jgi:autotransporter family porin
MSGLLMGRLSRWFKRTSDGTARRPVTHVLATCGAVARRKPFREPAAVSSSNNSAGKPRSMRSLSLAAARLIGAGGAGLLLAGFLVSSHVADGATTSVPWLKTSGNKIVTASGQPVTLRGANVLRSEWDLNMNAERRAIPVLANTWKGNVILRGFASDPVNSGNSNYLSMLDEHVSLAEANQLYVIFAWRSYEINGPQPDMPDDRAQTALVKLAQRYRGKPNVMYALQVEPHNVSWNQVQPRFVQMVDAIRAASSPYQPIILVPGVDWSRDLSGAVANPVRRENVVYKSHPYNEQGRFRQEFINAYDAGLPVFLGEFGVTPESGMTMTDVSALLSIARQRNIGWTAWAFDYQGGPALVSNNTTFDPTSPYGVAVRNEMVSTPAIPTGGGTPTATTTATVAPTPTRVDITSAVSTPTGGASSTPTAAWSSSPTAAPTGTSSARPPAGGYFGLLPPGSALPNDQECAARVHRSSWEPRPDNSDENATVPTSALNITAGWGGDPRGEAFKKRVTGNFTGTTDEIIQWGACKWGFQDEMIRATAVIESTWHMSANGDDGASFGLLQIKASVHTGTSPWAATSTAFNVDYTMAMRRACYEGYLWIGSQSSGDMLGCVGLWFSGDWHRGDGDYLASYQRAYQDKPWLNW